MNQLDYFGGIEQKKFEATGFFRIQQEGERQWLVDPEGNAFVSIGLNHLDDSNLKYHYNLNIWKEKYSANKDKWIREGLVKDMKDWGFNTIGWTQEYISGDWGKALDWGVNINLGHSTPWSAADYRTANMPYVLQLRVAEIEDWNGRPNFPDVYSSEFDVYAEWLARSICADHADSQNLIGYFFVDIASWQDHASGRDFPQLEGLSKEERNKKVYDIASKYYEVVTKHIRSYDKNHLILGDRYNGNKEIPTPVLEAMKPYVDVFSVQYFPANNEEGYRQMQQDLKKWHEITGKPVLIADIGNSCKTEMNPDRVYDLDGQAARAQDYIDSLRPLLDEPWFIGWHWCAYVENTARGWGCKTPFDEPYEDFVGPVREFNNKVYDNVLK